MQYESDSKNNLLGLDGKVLKASDIPAPIEFVAINADNDVNGNPRRGFLVFFGDQKAFIDDAYSGENWIIARGQKGFETKRLSRVSVKPAEYRRHMKEFPRIHNA